MDKLNMHTANKADENFAKLAEMFPSAVTEAIDGYDDEGKPIIARAIDKDVLMQEISTRVVDGNEERYQFTWPDKKKAVLAANAPISATLRPCKEESVDFDTTENLYIEGDNLDVLKLLQETYLGKVKMIYIDPPYNTGNDFVYDDNFAQTADEYMDNSGQYDTEGNRLFTNSESNGRFHTDWLNMIYPRLKIAKDLLKDDGVIFISIDDNEVENLKKVCNEVFGAWNFVVQFPWRKRTAKSDVPFGISQDYEWILCFAKSTNFLAGIESGSRKYFETPDFPDRPWRIHDMTTQRTATERPNSNFTIIDTKNQKEYPVNPRAVWRVTKDTIVDFQKQGRIVYPGDYDFLNISKPVLRYFKDDDAKKDGAMYGYSSASSNLPNEVGMSQNGTQLIAELFENKIFDYPKPVELVKHFLKIATPLSKDSIILDFFSGSATTAHAVMQLNSEDGGNRKFIMVQLPEETDEKSEAYKAGYKNICEIGKERIRRAGTKIKDENKLTAQNLDIGFRVLKLDSTNMKDVYYNPADFEPNLFDKLTDNIKDDRTPKDLLFQVMLELGVLLSSKIEESTIDDRRVFNVADGFLIACFDENVTDETVKAIAQYKPYYAVFRDSSMATDSVATNFDQVFAAYSPETIRKVL